MVTSAECRTLALVSNGEARAEGDPATRSILKNIARTWTSLANQTDRLSALRIAVDRPPTRPANYLRLVPTLWP